MTVSLIDAWFDVQPARAVQRLDALLGRIPLRSLPVDDRNYCKCPILRSRIWNGLVALPRSRGG